MRDLWYKTAVIYELDVETYADGNGDGIGDFAGLTSRLPYLAGLGITCLWLMPFYPTPNRDDGYDVADYYNVDPRLGTLGDFVQFTHEAERFGLRVVTDLVVNHTSDQHPWFKSARKSPSSPYRDWYVWSKTRPPNHDKGMVFPGVQKTTWTYDEQAKAYYFHRFYEFQPDLNVANQAVREEMERIMGFWLQLGVSGFRIDAAPFLIEHVDVPHQEKPTPDPFGHLRDFRGFVQWRRGNAVMLGEANVPMDTIVRYFGDGDRMHMLFNFHVNEHLWLAMVQERVEPIVKALRQLPELPEIAQWAMFLRNHDEIDLSGLSVEERQQVYAACGPEPTMQLYGRGIRRRLATMLNGNQRRIELALSLMFSLPGSPVLFYGDEIGMGDDMSLPERISVRVPMQWSDHPNGGFSTAPRRKLIRPVVRGGAFGYENVNVVRQQRDPDSILNHVERLIRTYKQCPALGWTRPNVIDTDQPSVLAQRADWRGESLLILHNLAETPCVARLHGARPEPARLIELLSDGAYVPVEHMDQPFFLEGHGYRWFRIDGHPPVSSETGG